MSLDPPRSSPLGQLSGPTTLSQPMALGVSEVAYKGGLDINIHVQKGRVQKNRHVNRGGRVEEAKS